MRALLITLLLVTPAAAQVNNPPPPTEEQKSEALFLAWEANGYSMKTWETPNWGLTFDYRKLKAERERLDSSVWPKLEKRK